MTELAEYEHIPIQPGAQTPALPIPASSIAVIVRSVSDPIFTAYTETGGSFDFGVKDTVYKVLGVSLLGVSLIMLIHPMCYFRRKYRDWRRAQHRKFVDPGEDARRSKTPPMEDVSF